MSDHLRLARREVAEPAIARVPLVVSMALLGMKVLTDVALGGTAAGSGRLRRRRRRWIH
jgi:hypothetical protein